MSKLNKAYVGIATAEYRGFKIRTIPLECRASPEIAVCIFDLEYGGSGIEECNTFADALKIIDNWFVTGTAL